MAYTIKAVTGNKPWAGQHGPMMSYYLTLVDGEGQETANVDLAQKPTSPAPQPGQTLEGNIDQGSYGPKFKKAFTQSFGGGGGYGQDAGGAGQHRPAALAGDGAARVGDRRDVRCGRSAAEHTRLLRVGGEDD
jgi:hypothetical protein